MSAPILCEIGAGISLWANAIHALEALGLGDAMQTHVLSELRGGLRLGVARSCLQPPRDELTQRFGVSMAVMRRADLLAVFVGQLSLSNCTSVTHA